MGGFAAQAAVVGLKTAMETKQQRDRIKAENALITAEQEARQRQAQQDLSLRQQRRQDLLAKAQAAQRARLAAIGIAGTGGSSDAILAGMTADTAKANSDDRDAVAARLSGPSNLTPVPSFSLLSGISQSLQTIGKSSRREPDEEW